MTDAATMIPVTWPIPAANRLGFAVKVLGRSGVPSNDARRWQSGPHLAVSLRCLDRVFDVLAAQGIRMYRMSSDIAPYATHPEMPWFHGQIAACANELGLLGARARRLGIRLSFHPSQYVVLNSPQGRVSALAAAEFGAHTDMLDAMGCDADAVIVTHAGGVYGDREAARQRFITRFLALPERVRHRLVLENDDVSWSVTDILPIHEATGIPLVFDTLHHHVLNPAKMDAGEALSRCLSTWPAGRKPKIHVSSQRRAERVTSRKNRTTGEITENVQPAKPGQHDDWIDPDEFVALIRETENHAFDVMLEAKRKDLALLRLRTAILNAGLRHRIW